MPNSDSTVVTFALVMLLLVVAVAVSSTSAQKQQTVSVLVYSDSTLKTQVSTFSWGEVNPGISVSKYLWIKNYSTIPVTVTFTAANHQPLEASTLKLTSDFDGKILKPSENSSVILTLNVPKNISVISSFSFTVNVQAFAS